MVNDILNIKEVRQILENKLGIDKRQRLYRHNISYDEYYFWVKDTTLKIIAVVSYERVDSITLYNEDKELVRIQAHIKLVKWLCKWVKKIVKITKVYNNE